MRFIYNIFSASGFFCYSNITLLLPVTSCSLLSSRVGGLALRTYMSRIHSIVCMYGPCCCLLCLIQLFKAQYLHVKLHAFPPSLSLLCSLSHLYVYASSAYSYASLVCVSESKAWPSCQNSLLSYSSPAHYLSNKPMSYSCSSNARLLIANAVKHMFPFTFYTQHVKNERRIYYTIHLRESIISWCMWVCFFVLMFISILSTKAGKLIWKIR